MEKIILEDLESINKYYAQIQNIISVRYHNNDEDKSLIFKCIEHEEEEDETYIINIEEEEVLQINFKQVKCFYLPANFYFPIYEIRLVPENDIEKFSPFFDKENISKNYNYYQLIIMERDESIVETDFYVYCAAIKGELILNYTEYTLYYTNHLGESISTSDNKVFNTKNNKTEEICYQSYKSIEEAKNVGKAGVKNPLVSTCYIRFGNNYELTLQAEQDDFELSCQKHEYTKNDRSDKDSESIFDKVVISFAVLFMVLISIIVIAVTPLAILIVSFLILTEKLEKKLSKRGFSQFTIYSISLAIFGGLTYFIFWLIKLYDIV